MSKTQVIRIREGELLKDNDTQKFLLKFFGSNQLVKDPVAAFMELARQVHIDNLGLFIGRDGEGELRGAMLAQLSTSAMNPACVVLHIHVDNSPAVRRELMKELITYAREGGYENIIAIDTNRKPEAFGKLFSVLGTPKQLGSVFNFDLSESLL